MRAVPGSRSTESGGQGHGKVVGMSAQDTGPGAFSACPAVLDGAGEGALLSLCCPFRDRVVPFASLLARRPVDLIPMALLPATHPLPYPPGAPTRGSPRHSGPGHVPLWQRCCLVHTLWSPRASPTSPTSAPRPRPGEAWRPNWAQGVGQALSAFQSCLCRELSPSQRPGSRGERACPPPPSTDAEAGGPCSFRSRPSGSLRSWDVQDGGGGVMQVLGVNASGWPCVCPGPGRLLFPQGFYDILILFSLLPYQISNKLLVKYKQNRNIEISTG